MAVVLGFIAVGCGGSASATEPVSVFAAASLTDVFRELIVDFEEKHPEYNVELNVGGSSSLREQIRAGAPADVFASANVEISASLFDDGLLAAAPDVFATNRLTIAVPPGNPGAVTRVEDFAREELLIGLCAEAVPCGQAALATFEELGVVPLPDTNEPDVRSLMTKIELGELDVGVVYETDVLASDAGVEALTFDSAASSVTAYPIAAVGDAPNPDGADAFVAFVLSGDAARVITSHGFGAAS